MFDDETAAVDTSLAVDSGAAIETAETTEVITPGEQTPVETGKVERTDESQVEAGKEEDLREFAPSISARLREITKKAPELDGVFKKYPDVRNSFEATFRRDAAYRELFPTVADARQLREMFPNGPSDAQQVLNELAEMETLDRNFVSRDGSGHYGGHSQIIRDMQEMDAAAFSALLETGVKEWARTSPEAYNRTFSAIIGATFQQEGIFRHLEQLQRMAASSQDENLKAGIEELANWAKGFSQDSQRRELSPEARRLQEERQALDRDKATRGREDVERFDKTFFAESQRLQRQIVENHPLIKRLPPAVAAEKRGKIVNEVISKIQAHLSGNRSFMRTLTPAYNSMDLKSTLDIQKAAWNQPWLLNMYVRKVLGEATPGIVQATRPGAPKPPTKPAVPAGRGQETRRTVDYQVGKQWYHADGRKFTIEEALRMP